MDEKPDHGDIVMQRRVDIDFGDTGETLFRKIAGEGRILLREALPLLAAGTAPRLPQDHSGATYFGRRVPEDGWIDWSWRASRIYNLVRAVTRPYPGAFTTLGGKKLFLWWGVPVERRGEESGAVAGTVLGPRRGGVGIAAGEGVFLAIEAQLEGRRETTGERGLAGLLPAGTYLPS
jgi:methionyl-tRNA formyltransferase